MRNAVLLLLGPCAAAMSSVAPNIKLYTHTACPFAQRVWIALEATELPFEKVDVNLYGLGGFDKRALKEVEKAGGLSPPKGYIPVMSINDEVIRESSVCVERVAKLSAQYSNSRSLVPEEPTVAQDLISRCNALPKQPSSPQLDDLLQKADEACAETAFLAGGTFSIADACLLPFLQRVESDMPPDAKHLQAYMARCHELSAFKKTVVANWWWWW
jgi:glutathione S-transferase